MNAKALTRVGVVTYLAGIAGWAFVLTRHGPGWALAVCIGVEAAGLAEACWGSHLRRKARRQ